MKSSFPVVIQRLESKDGARFRATTSIDRLSTSTRSVEQDLHAVELDYTIMLATVREALHQAAQDKRRKDPRIYWYAGEAILAMLKRLQESGFYLVRQNATIARDVGFKLSSSSLGKILAFRRRFPRITDVDPQIPWSRYRDNRVVPPRARKDEDSR